MYGLVSTFKKHNFFCAYTSGWWKTLLKMMTPADFFFLSGICESVLVFI